MKVYMSNYPKYLSPRRYLNEDIDTHKYPAVIYTAIDRWNAFLDRYPLISRVLERILNPIQERVILVKIDYHDVFSMDHTLSYIIHAMLLQLKVQKHGAPSVDDDDVPDEIRSYQDHSDHDNNFGDVDKFFFKRWDYVLDEMIFAFNAIKEDQDDKEYSERVQNGLNLFAKYYFSLWD